MFHLSSVVLDAELYAGCSRRERTLNYVPLQLVDKHYNLAVVKFSLLQRESLLAIRMTDHKLIELTTRSQTLSVLRLECVRKESLSTRKPTLTAILEGITITHKDL